MPVCQYQEHGAVLLLEVERDLFDRVVLDA